MKLTERGTLRAVWVFSLIAWLYVAIDRWVNPQLQKAAMSPYIPIPQDIVGIISFAVAFIAFALWGSAEK
jgi:hypothetical protein